jgi:CRISPR/Cas system-associated exonuclease Cas4 (RecB family)
MLAQAETGLSYNKIVCYIDFYDRETSEIVKREEISVDAPNTFSVRKILMEIRDISLRKLSPKVTQNPKKCWSCSVKHFCDYSR